MNEDVSNSNQVNRVGHTMVYTAAPCFDFGQGSVSQQRENVYLLSRDAMTHWLQPLGGTNSSASSVNPFGHKQCDCYQFDWLAEGAGLPGTSKAAYQKAIDMDALILGSNSSTLTRVNELNAHQSGAVCSGRVLSTFLICSFSRALSFTTANLRMGRLCSCRQSRQGARFVFCIILLPFAYIFILESLTHARYRQRLYGSSTDARDTNADTSFMYAARFIRIAHALPQMGALWHGQRRGQSELNKLVTNSRQLKNQFTELSWRIGGSCCHCCMPPLLLRLLLRLRVRIGLRQRQGSA